MRLFARLVLLLAVLAIMALAAFGRAYAHDAPSGWPYPSECCGGNDCHPVECSDVEETAYGWLWDGVPFPRPSVKSSHDRQCHACTQNYSDLSGASRRFGRCLFILEGF